jgi:hypothetical protein
MLIGTAGRHGGGMTAFAAPIQSTPSLIDWRPLRRLIGASIVGGIGMIAFSVAVGNQVIGSMRTLPAATAGDAHALLGAVPWIAAIGVAHVAVAIALARGGDAVRLVAVAITGLTAVVAATAAALTAAGVDPFGWTATGHPAASGIGILAIAAALYATAAAAVGIGSAESD